MGKIRLVPPVYFLIAVVAAVLLHRLLPGMQLIGWPWRWAGLVALVPVAFLAGPGARSLSRRGTTLHPFGEPTALVMEGPFRYTRNPLYLSLALLLTGVVILLGSLTPWLTVPALVAGITRTFIRREEAVLGTAFGAAYQNYCRQVRRWI